MNFLCIFPFLWECFLRYFKCLNTIISFLVIPYVSKGVYLRPFCYFFSFLLFYLFILFFSLSLLFFFLLDGSLYASASKTTKEDFTGFLL